MPRRTSAPGFDWLGCAPPAVLGRRQQSRERAGYFQLSRDDCSFRRLLDDQPDDVAGLEAAIDQVRRDGQTPFTRQVEGLFHLVREPGEVRETGGCPRSLDGVNGPEYPVHQARIARRRLQRQEGGVELNQQVQGLSPECDPHLLHNVD